MSATVILYAPYNPNVFFELGCQGRVNLAVGLVLWGTFSWGPICYLKGSPPYIIVISTNYSTEAVEDVPLAVRRTCFRSTELRHTVENISGGDLTRHTQERYVGREGLIAWPPC